MSSFLTKDLNADPKSPEYWLIRNAVYQGLILLVTSITLVSPNPAPMVFYSFLAFWIGVLISALRRRSLMHPTDILYLKYGAVSCLIFGSFFAGTLVPLSQSIFGR